MRERAQAMEGGRDMDSGRRGGTAGNEKYYEKYYEQENVLHGPSLTAGNTGWAAA